jgi:hypothetical protein
MRNHPQKATRIGCKPAGWLFSFEGSGVFTRSVAGVHPETPDGHRQVSESQAIPQIDAVTAEKNRFRADASWVSTSGGQMDQFSALLAGTSFEIMKKKKKIKGLKDSTGELAGLALSYVPSQVQMKFGDIETTARLVGAGTLNMRAVDLALYEWAADKFGATKESLDKIRGFNFREITEYGKVYVIWKEGFEPNMAVEKKWWQVWKSSRATGTRLKSEQEIIKYLLRQSHGARDFTRKISKIKGFRIVDEGPMGIEVRGKNCKFVYSVLASCESDKIFSFVYKEGDNPSIALIEEGIRRF